MVLTQWFCCTARFGACFPRTPAASAPAVRQPLVLSAAVDISEMQPPTSSLGSCARRNHPSLPSLFTPVRHHGCMNAAHWCTLSPTSRSNHSASVFIIYCPPYSFVSPFTPGSVVLTLGCPLLSNSDCCNVSFWLPGLEALPSHGRTEECPTTLLPTPSATVEKVLNTLGLPNR